MNKLSGYEKLVPSRNMCLFYDEIYSSGLDRTARFPVDRYAKLAAKIKQEDVDELVKLRQPRLATLEDKIRVTKSV